MYVRVIHRVRSRRRYLRHCYHSIHRMRSRRRYYAIAIILSLSFIRYKTKIEW